MTPLQVVLPLAALGLALPLWQVAGWLVAAFGLPVATLLQQAALLMLLICALEVLLGRLVPPADPGH